jgi:hypothetical protein
MASPQRRKAIIPDGRLLDVDELCWQILRKSIPAFDKPNRERACGGGAVPDEWSHSEVSLRLSVLDGIRKPRLGFSPSFC